MRSSKLYSVLKKFDKYEQNRCRKYIQSPYFNNSSELITLFELFVEDINRDFLLPFDKEKLWQIMIINKEFDDIRWRKYCSDLFKLLEGYLAQEEYSKDKFQQTGYLMDAASNRKINHLRKSLEGRAGRIIDHSDIRNAAWHYDNYEFEKRKYIIRQNDRQRTAVGNLEDILSSLDNFYITEKLKYYSAMLSSKTLVSHDYEVKLMNHILEFLKKENEDEMAPSVKIYFKIAQVLKESSNEVHYFQLKSYLLEYTHLFTQDEAADIYTFAINYVTRQLNAGNQKYWREYFELHQQLLSTKILIVNNEMDVGIFKNIIAAGLRINEHDWVKSFIEDYQEFLPENQRENAVTFNTAQLYFHEHKYDDVKKLLQKVEYEDYIYNVSSKLLLLRTYYESKNYDSFYSLIDSFRAYLYRNNEISRNRKQIYSNFLTFAKKLAKIRKKDTKSIEELKNDIKTSPSIANRSWLLEKLSELEQTSTSR